jgi:uncharacterized RDD family membrane protein YckC
MRSRAAPLHEVSTIETPEQIEVDLALAGVGSRGLAYLVDLLWQIVPVVAAGLLVFALLPSNVRPGRFIETGADGQPRLQLLALALLSAVLFFVNFGYFALFEVLYKGQSPGKRMLGLRVVRDGGYPIDGRSALVRNLLRAVDFLPAFYFFGMGALFIGRSGKRIGDYAAGTCVVREHKPSKVPATAPSLAAVGLLSMAERSLVAEFLTRRPGMSADARARVGRVLADRLAARLGEPAPPDPERFLEAVQ